MVRFLSIAVALAAFAFLVHGMSDGAALQKAQMVKGTVKEVQLDKNVLVVNQKVKNEFVDRELSIETSTEFIIMIKGDTKKGTGADGLKILADAKAKGANVAVKCDKDVKVLSVKVTVK